MSGTDYRTQFEAARADLAGAGLPWLDSLRERAIARFAADGFPGPKVEEWKYADLASLGKSAFVLAPDARVDLSVAIARFALPTASHRIVFVNGRFRPNLSTLENLPDGVTVTGLAVAMNEAPETVRETLREDADWVEDRLSGRNDPRPFAFVALNTAFAGDGVVIRFARGASTDLPIHVIHLAAPDGKEQMIQTRNLIIAEDGASGLVMETYGAVDDRPYFHNAVTEVRAARDAHLRHYRWQHESPNATHIGTILAELDHASGYSSFVLSTGSAYGRNEIRARLAGEHIHCRLDGAYLGTASQRLDTWTRIDMEMPNGTVSETYKSVLADRARGAFQGKIRVHEGAMKADARQLNNNLLLSPEAQADSKPELEILADDVRCAHGSTVGDIDEQALFYLRARGIDAERARTLLIEAFIGDLIDHIGYSTAHDYLRNAFEGWLDRLSAGGTR